MATKSTRSAGRGSKVKGSDTNTNPYSSKRRGTKKSVIAKAGSAMSATRGQHGGRRKSV